MAPDPRHSRAGHSAAWRTRGGIEADLALCNGDLLGRRHRIVESVHVSHIAGQRFQDGCEADPTDLVNSAKVLATVASDCTSRARAIQVVTFQERFQDLRPLANPLLQQLPNHFSSIACHLTAGLILDDGPRLLLG